MPSRPSIAWLCASLVSLSATVQAELWTNVAGRVVDASVVSVTGQMVELKGTDGQSFFMPLHALVEASQSRALKGAGHPAVPQNVLRSFDAASKMTARAKILFENERIAPEQFDVLRAEARAAFDRDLQRLLSVEEQQRYDEEIQKLRDRL